MKAFIYNGRTYIRAIPTKRLFNSTTVHEVVNRGDIFAVEVGTALLTIVPGTAEVEHIELTFERAPAKAKPATVQDKLQAVKLGLQESHQAALPTVARFGIGDIVRFTWQPVSTLRRDYKIVREVQEDAKGCFSYIVYPNDPQLAPIGRRVAEANLCGWREA